jgi:hypothetical protein
MEGRRNVQRGATSAVSYERSGRSAQRSHCHYLLNCPSIESCASCEFYPFFAVLWM